jgi:4-aminobutyrate aminotransferase-like enzyme
MVNNEGFNDNEEERCFKEFKRTVRESEFPVRAIIMEPLTFFGNYFATPTFYQKVREFAAKEDIPFIVDETRSGVGITGKYWGHEHWYLENAPDFVVFGRASQVSGYYCKLEFRPRQIHKFSNVG